MALQLTKNDIQFMVTNTARSFVTLVQDYARAKTFLDQVDLMAEPYNFTQEENDILKGSVNDAVYGLNTTTKTNINKQAGLF